MSIIQRAITDLSPHSGGFRARFSYTFDDGRVVSRGPSFVSSEEDANAKMLSIEPSVTLYMQNKDAENAIESDISNTHRTASDKQVKLAWLEKGFRQAEAYKSYFFLKKVMPELLALNKTNIQLAAILGTSVKVVVELKDLWEYLAVNSLAIESYTIIQRNR